MNNKTTQLQSDIQKALKNGDSVRASTLKFLYSKVANAQIDARGRGEEFNDSDFEKVVLKDVKSHQESIEAYKTAGRQELVDQEEAQLAVLQEYAPQMLGEEELNNIIAQKAEELKEAGQLNFGSLMKTVMVEVSGKADGELVKILVQKSLL